jgi:Universal stress protein family
VTWAVLAVLAVVVIFVALALRSRRRRVVASRHTVGRILVPFTGGALDPTVLAAGIRIARAEDATLVPAYLIVVPLEQPEDAPMQQQVTTAMPLLEAIEHAALRAGVPVDTRIESGRTPVHALKRLWESEHFDRIVVPAPAGRRRGFTPKDLTWMLTHAPSETLILRPDPAVTVENGGVRPALPAVVSPS